MENGLLNARASVKFLRELKYINRLHSEAVCVYYCWFLVILGIRTVLSFEKYLAAYLCEILM